MKHYAKYQVIETGSIVWSLPQNNILYAYLVGGLVRVDLDIYEGIVNNDLYRWIEAKFKPLELISIYNIYKI